MREENIEFGLVYRCRKCNMNKNKSDFYVINKKSRSTCKKCICSDKSIKYSKSGRESGINLLERGKLLISICKRIYGENYEYSNLNYEGALKKVCVTCKSHGDFLVRPNHLRNGHGCPKCGNKNKGYNRNRFIDKANKSYCYIIICSNMDEIFIKIGITGKKLSDRFNSNTSMPYSYEEYKIIEGNSDYIFNLEKMLHEKLNNYRYLPVKFFNGCKNECFEIGGMGILEEEMKHFSMNSV